ncbi:hypothetical protein QOT17_002306 [Balamuthia mandrillaris]
MDERITEEERGAERTPPVVVTYGRKSGSRSTSFKITGKKWGDSKVVWEGKPDLPPDEPQRQPLDTLSRKRKREKEEEESSLLPTSDDDNNTKKNEDGRFNEKREEKEKEKEVEEKEAKQLKKSKLNNAKPPRLTQMTITAFSRSPVARNRPLLSPKKENEAKGKADKEKQEKKKKQMFLDFGQSKNFDWKECPECKMMYAPGLPNDEKMHSRFHRDYLRQEEERRKKLLMLEKKMLV